MNIHSTYNRRSVSSLTGCLTLRTVVFSALMAVMAACSSSSGDEPAMKPSEPSQPVAGQQPIRLTSRSVSESTASASSRADSPLESLYNDFAVTTFKTNSLGSQELVMGTGASDPYRVQFAGAAKGWTYEIGNQYLKYWDQSARDYTFNAFAPYSTAHTVTTDGAILFRGVEGGKADVTDWLISHYQRTNNGGTVKDTDLLAPTATIKQPQALTSEVPLIFHHLLSQIQFKLYASDGVLPRVTKVEFKVMDEATICTKANYDTKQGVIDAITTTADIYTGAPVEDFKESIPTYEEALLLCSVAEIPQTLPTDCRVGVDITLEGGKKVTAALNFYDATKAWESNKIYIYYLRLSMNPDNLILVDVKVQDWIKAGETEIIEQDNW